jgi:hypothetical protein
MLEADAISADLVLLVVTLIFFREERLTNIFKSVGAGFPYIVFGDMGRYLKGPPEGSNGSGLSTS